MSCTRQQLNAFFDDLLAPQRFKDYCPNGLQVEGKTDVRHLVTGVTASQALIEAARDRRADAAITDRGGRRGTAARISQLEPWLRA